MSRARVLIAILAILPFLSALGFGFLNYDDPRYVYSNPTVLRGLTWDGIVWAFSTTYNGMWNPVAWLSFMLDAELFGTASGYHLTNILVHAGSCLLVSVLIFRLTRDPAVALVTTVMFSVHPLHVEAVVWISERRGLLSSFFGLAAFTLYIKVGFGSKKDYAAFLGLLVISLLSKPVFVTAPVLLCLLDRALVWGRGRDKYHPDRRLKLAVVVISVTACAFAYYAERTNGTISDVDHAFRVGSALTNPIVYLRRLFLPFGLCVLYPRPSWVEGWTVLAAAAIIIVLLRVAYALRGSRPWWFLGLLWFFVTLLPVVGLIPIGPHSTADRYMYIPMLGVVTPVAIEGVGLWRSFRRRGRLFLGVLAVVVVMTEAGLTLAQLHLWSNSEVVWRTCIARTADNWLAFNNLGAELYKHGGREPEAEQCFRKALAIAPSYVAARDNLVMLLYSRGRTNEVQCIYSLEASKGDDASTR